MWRKSLVFPQILAVIKQFFHLSSDSLDRPWGKRNYKKKKVTLHVIVLESLLLKRNVQQVNLSQRWWYWKSQIYWWIWVKCPLWRHRFMTQSRSCLWPSHILWSEAGGQCFYSFTYICFVWIETLPRYLSLEPGSPNLTAAEYSFKSSFHSFS